MVIIKYDAGITIAELFFKMRESRKFEYITRIMLNPIKTIIASIETTSKISLTEGLQPGPSPHKPQEDISKFNPITKKRGAERGISNQPKDKGIFLFMDIDIFLLNF
mgnify:CR=1 FL=1